MGERIRLFSTASFVTSSNEENENCLPKTKSLDSFSEPTETLLTPPPHTQTISMKCHRVKVCPRPAGSIVSLNSQLVIEVDDVHIMKRVPSQLGMLCQHCSTADLPCAKATQQEMRSPSASSLYSISHASFSSPNDPLCRICHCTWPSDPLDPLISPCRCSGSLQYVHVSCLMHWLDISSRKLHRPAVCELCLYKYRRRRTLKYREIKMPECSSQDMKYYTLFLTSILMMIFSAAATVLCFQLEKKYAPDKSLPNQSTSNSTDSSHLSEDMENFLSTVTLISAIAFFLSFFLAMYAHVKSAVSLYSYISLCWTSNLEWSIEEYRISRDTQYLNKLEELRRKINEKQKKAPEEIEPLRSSIIVIE